MIASKALSLVEGSPLHGLLGLHIEVESGAPLGSEELSGALHDLREIGYMHPPVVFKNASDVEPQYDLWSAVLLLLSRGHAVVGHVQSDKWANWYTAATAVVVHHTPGQAWHDYACDTFKHHAALPLDTALPYVNNARRRELVVTNKPKPQEYMEFFKAYPGWAVEGPKIPTVRL